MQAVTAAKWDSPEWNEALDALGRANTALVFSPQETPESKRYAVQRGDSITNIGNTLNTTQGMLMRANGIDENTVLSLGQQIKYTPNGNKEKNPIWHKPGAGAIPAGDPGNELGTRWMPLIPERDGLPKDLGIHGTIRPETVGQYSSNGCARLLPAEIEELDDLVVRSTPVDIVETFAMEAGSPSPAPTGTTGA
ncbi:MAG: L,D-transpeptidase family protein [Candidatus Hydrogenedentes bacterium]|nr:L,D-transpeptidase family protein [Candidatus Hydrogenedentota bacterium]